MKKNMGSMDRLIRILIAFTIGFLYFSKLITGVTALVLGIFAIILVATSLLSFCPLYLPFGLSTSKNNQQS